MSDAHSEELSSEPALVKAAMILNLIKFVGFADNGSSNSSSNTSGVMPLQLCLLNKSEEVSRALSTLNGKVVQERPLNVKVLEPPETSSNCHILYVPHDEAARFQSFDPASVTMMTISDIAGFAEHQGVVELHVEIGQRPAFLINLGAARKAHLKFPAQVLKLATMVYESLDN